MTNLKKRILKKIKCEKACPIDRKYFLFKNIFIWMSVLIMIILGVFATMLLFYFAANLELLEFIIEIPALAPKVVFLGLPLVWIFAATSFAFFAGMTVGKTKKGYKLSKLMVAGVILGTQIFGGALLASTPVAEKTEQKLHQISRHLGDLERRKERLWKNPENGFLSGKIELIFPDGNWMIVNYEQEAWMVQIEEETMMPGHITFQVGDRVRLRGQIDPSLDKSFMAERVFPFKGKRKDFRLQMRKIMEHMSPEKRVAFRERRKAMRNMSPEERRVYRETLKKEFPEINTRRKGGEE